jgi:hypothetical protein
VNSAATTNFWRLYLSLPPAAQNLANKTYQLWRSNPAHPSLRFRRLQGSSTRYTIRIGDHYRALAFRQGETMVWVWIGSHSDYDRMVNST